MAKLVGKIIGTVCGIAIMSFIICTIYNCIAMKFNLPHLNFWVFFGAYSVLKMLLPKKIKKTIDK